MSKKNTKWKKIKEENNHHHPKKNPPKTKAGYVYLLFIWEIELTFLTSPNAANVSFLYVNSPFLVIPAVCVTVYICNTQWNVPAKKSIAIIIVIYHHHKPSSAVVSHHVFHAKCGCALSCLWIAENCLDNLLSFCWVSFGWLAE